MKKISNHSVTSWVAILIIAAVGSTCVYFIWASANDSWGHDYIYPEFNRSVSKLLSNIETVGWKTYQDQGYGFKISYPSKYSDTIGTIVPNSVLGVPATTVGPLVFIKADNSSLKAAAEEKFDHYWDLPGKLESPSSYCRKQILDNDNAEIRFVYCLINGKEERYAHVKGKTFDIFIDGYSMGNNQKLKDVYVQATKVMSQAEFAEVLNSFEFLNF